MITEQTPSAEEHVLKQRKAPEQQVNGHESNDLYNDQPLFFRSESYSAASLTESHTDQMRSKTYSFFWNVTLMVKLHPAQ